MRVALSNAALASPESWRILDRILDLLGRDRHIWQIDDFSQIDSSEWLAEDSRTTRMNRELSAKAFTAQAYSGALLVHSLSIIVTPTPTSAQLNELTPAHAITAMQSPAFLILENADSDAEFFRALSQAYSRDHLLNGLDTGAIAIENAGGHGGLRPAVERILAKKIPGPIRIVVLRDSDRFHPDDPPSKVVAELCGWCAKEGVYVHVLHKREAENYLPLSALGPPSAVPQEFVPRASRCYQAFLTLSQSQKDHYDMKFGFTHGVMNTININSQHRDLYDGLSQSTLSNLREGFGENVGSHFSVRAFNRDDFEQLCSERPGELDAFLDRVERLL